MDKTVLFHCAMPVVDENENIVVNESGKVLKETPTHTLAFRKFGGNLLVGWSKPLAGFDSYNKKEGRRIAEERLSHLENRLTNYAERGVYEIDDLSPKYLPSVIIENNFDFYLEKAIKTLFEENELEDVNLVFRSYRKEEPVCAISVSITEEDVIDDELVSEKGNEDNSTSDYIFASWENEEGETVVHVQPRDIYADNGYTDVVDEDMVNVLAPVMNEVGFLIVDDQKPILVHEDMAEIDVVRYLKSKGLGYSIQLEEELTA